MYSVCIVCHLGFSSSHDEGLQCWWLLWSLKIKIRSVQGPEAWRLWRVFFWDKASISRSMSGLVAKPHYWSQLCSGIYICDLTEAQGSLILSAVGVCCCVKQQSTDKTSKRSKSCLFVLRNPLVGTLLFRNWHEVSSLEKNWCFVCFKLWTCCTNPPWIEGTVCAGLPQTGTAVQCWLQELYSAIPEICWSLALMHTGC